MIDYNKIIQNPEYLEEICKKGAEKAHKIASKTLRIVYDKIGII